VDPVFVIEHDNAVVQIVDDRAQRADLPRHLRILGAAVLSATC